MTPTRSTQALVKGDLETILHHITFAPSCVDMGWDWDIQEVYGPAGDVTGWNIRTTFQRPDTDTGEIGTGHGRWWFVERGAYTSGIVKTAWLACKQIVEHELMEAFLYDGVRIFNPHADIFDLATLHR